MAGIKINAKAKAMYGKVQAVFGTGETLATTDIVRTKALEFDALTGERASIEYDGSSGRDTVERATSQTNTVKWEMDLIGGGDDGGTAIFEPPCAPFLQASGWDMDTSVANEVTFSLSDRTAIDVVTLAVNQKVTTNSPTSFDVDQYKTIDARGTAGMDFSSDFPKLMFNDFVGTYVEPARVDATALGTTQPTSFVSPLPFSAASFTTLTFNSQALCAHSLVIPKLGWTQSRTDVVNCAETNLMEEKMTIDITFMMLDMDSSNIWAWANDLAGLNYYDFALVFDTRVGHILKLDAVCRMVNPKLVALSDGNQGIQCQLEVRSDELTFGWYAA